MIMLVGHFAKLRRTTEDRTLFNTKWESSISLFSWQSLFPVSVNQTHAYAVL